MEPEAEQSVEEHMVKFKSRSSIMRQHIKNKPIKWGFKMSYRCAPKHYTGKKKTSGFGLGKSVVLQATRKLNGSYCRSSSITFLRHNLRKMTDNSELFQKTESFCQKSKKHQRTKVKHQWISPHHKKDGVKLSKNVCFNKKIVEIDAAGVLEIFYRKSVHDYMGKTARNF